jgi:hypothetical protein
VERFSVTAADSPLAVAWHVARDTLDDELDSAESLVVGDLVLLWHVLAGVVADRAVPDREAAYFRPAIYASSSTPRWLHAHAYTASDTAVYSRQTPSRVRVLPSSPDEHADALELDSCRLSCAHPRPARIGLARLLTRVVESDIEHCPNCGGG